MVQGKDEKFDPMFQLNAESWLCRSRIRALSPSERGRYIDLLCLGVVNRGLPNELALMRRNLGMPKHRFERIWPELKEDWREFNGLLLPRCKFGPEPEEARP